MGSLKKYVSAKWHFLTLFPLCHNMSFFLQPTSTLRHSLKCEKLCHGMEESYFCVCGCLSMSNYLRRSRKNWKILFQPMRTLILHINTHVWICKEVLEYVMLLNCGIIILWVWWYWYVRRTDNLFDIFSLQLAIILSELREIQSRKQLLRK